MDGLLITIGNDELLGLQALARFEGAHRTATPAEGSDAGSDPGSDAVDVEQFQELARSALRDGLADRLRRVDLPWAPTAEAVDQALLANSPGREAAPANGLTAAPAREASLAAAEVDAASPTPVARLRAMTQNERVMRNTGIVLGAAFMVALIGGYGAGWTWTGFQTNDQVWDWLNLLLLPVAFALLPVWLRYSQHMSRTRKVALASAVAAFWIFVAVGYLVPLNWTGFKGQMLWNWLVLIALPVTLVTVRAWPTTGREVRKAHITVFTVLAAAWVVTLIGGYAGSWHWTGYPGNTLWEWLQLLLLPIVFPTILLPAFLKWTSGGASQLAEEEAAGRDAAAVQPGAATPADGQGVEAQRAKA